MKPYYQDESVVLYNADCRELNLPAFDCVIADPPFAETRLAWDRWPAGWPGWLITQIQRPCSMWCFGTFRMWWKYRDEFEGWGIGQDIIWEKQNGTGLHNDRFRKVHEQPVQFYPDFYDWRDVFKSPRYTYDAKRKRIIRCSKPKHWDQIGNHTFESEVGGPRLMRSVLKYKNTHRMKGKINETQKPADFVQLLVDYSCPPGGTLLDLMAGSATASVVAKLSGRKSIAVEFRESECEKAARRLAAITIPTKAVA
jgi:site-specific DNA-methyltransferase (adenine-specific)